MKRIAAALFGLCLIATSAVAFWQSRDSNYNIAISGNAPTLTVTTLGNGSSGASSGTSVSLTVANALAAGKLSVVLFTDSNTTAPVVACVDSKVNVYSAGPSLASAGLYEFHSFITTPLTTSDTITCSDSAATGTNFFEITAFTFSASAYDSGAANTNTSGFGTTFSVTSGSPAVANETFVAFSITNATGFTALPSGWTNNPPTINACCTVNQLAGAEISAGAATWAGTTTSSQVTSSIISGYKP